MHVIMLYAQWRDRLNVCKPSALLQLECNTLMSWSFDCSHSKSTEAVCSVIVYVPTQQHLRRALLLRSNLGRTLA